jgi:hypothetical protein
VAKEVIPKKPLTKTELLANIAAATDVPKKQVRVRSPSQAW